MGRSLCHPSSAAQGHRATREHPARGTDLSGGRLTLTHSCTGHSHPCAQSWEWQSCPHREVLGCSEDVCRAPLPAVTWRSTELIRLHSINTAG